MSKRVTLSAACGVLVATIVAASPIPHHKEVGTDALPPPCTYGPLLTCTELPPDTRPAAEREYHPQDNPQGYPWSYNLNGAELWCPPQCPY